MRITKGLVSMMLLAMSLGGSGAVYAASSTPSIHMIEQADDSIEIHVENMPSTPVYGIEVEVNGTETIRNEVHFETEHDQGTDVLKVDGTSITIYMADDQPMSAQGRMSIGTIKGLKDVAFIPTGRIKMVDGTFKETEWQHVALHYQEKEGEKPEPEKPEPEKPEPEKPEPEKPEPEKPNPSRPKPVKPKPEVEDDEKPTILLPASNYFTDTEGHWAQKEISEMVEKGILVGYEDGTFKPNAPITRSEIAVVINSAFALKDSGEQVKFSDVVTGKWYTQAIQNLYASGITAGRPDGTFGATDYITNEEVIVMLHRALKSQHVTLEKERPYKPFVDEAAISQWASEAVEALYRAMIVSGTPEGSLRPGAEVTRAQVAAMVQRILTLIQ